jgi:hypothetical protein
MEHKTESCGGQGFIATANRAMPSLIVTASELPGPLADKYKKNEAQIYLRQIKQELLSRVIK